MNLIPLILFYNFIQYLSSALVQAWRTQNWFYLKLAFTKQITTKGVKEQGNLEHWEIRNEKPCSKLIRVGCEERSRLLEREKVVWKSQYGGITGVVGVIEGRCKVGG